ncbi:MAG TPA: hypothetical protein VNT55_00155, partial [Baekduia sp.]|nr:hypothetical protein [Baekduia sp.]
MRTGFRMMAAAMTIGAAGLAGCGGGGDDAPATTAAPAAAAAPAKTTATETTDTTAAVAATDTSSSAETPLGTTLKLGEPGVVVYDDTIHHHSSAVKITPHAIEAGSIDDFKNIKL